MTTSIPEAVVDYKEELELFRKTGELEAKAFELVRTIPEERRGPLEGKGQQRTVGPLRERVREIVIRLQKEDPCELSRKAYSLICQADALYWEMVLHWDRMVFKESWNKPHREDVLQEGRCGMYRACLRFDPSKGFRFFTYARNWLAQSIRIYLSEEISSIRVPRRDQETRSKLLQAQILLETGLNRDVSLEEAAEWVGMEGRELEQALNAIWCWSSSIEESVHLGDDPGTIVTLKDTFKYEEDPLEVLEQSRDREILKTLLGRLTPRERFIVELHWLSFDPLSYQEIGNELGVSRERVRQILKQAFLRLQNPQPED